MGICNIDENNELANNIADYINASILESFSSKKPFKISSVMLELYQALTKTDKDVEKALGIIRIVPDLFFDIIAVNPVEKGEQSYLEKLAENNFDLKAAAKFKNELNAAADPIKFLSETLINRKALSVKKSLENKGNLTPKETKQVPKGPAESAETVYNKLIVILSLLAGTGVSQVEVDYTRDGKPVTDNKGNPIKKKVVNQSDPTKHLYYNTLQKLLDKADDNKTNFRDILYSGHRGFRLRALSEQDLPLNQLYPGVTATSRNVIAITNNKGEFLYFDKDGNITTEAKGGKIVYFTMLANNAINMKNILDARMENIESVIQEQAGYNKDKADKLRESYRSKFKAQLEEESNKIKQISEKLMSGEKVLLDITGGSKGAADNIHEGDLKELDAKTKAEAKQPLSNYKLTKKEKDSIKLSRIRKRNGTTITTPTIKFDNYDKDVQLIGVPIGDSQKGNPALLKNLVDVLIDDLTFKDKKPVTANQKIKYFNQFGKVKDLVLDENGNTVDITIGNQKIDLTNKDEAKESLMSFLADNMWISYITNPKNSYDTYTITDGVVSVKSDNVYSDFIMKYLIPSTPFDKNTSRPMINNGYFVFDIAEDPAEVEKEVKETIKKTKEIIKDDPEDFNNFANLFTRSKLIKSKANAEQKARADVWAQESGLLNDVDETGKKLWNIDMLTDTVNSNAFASFFKSTITLYKGSDSTHLYHEAWHVFSQMYLTKADKNKLYENVSKLDGTFTVVRQIPGQGGTNLKRTNVKFSEASRRELEEFIAEEFRIYAMNNGKFVVKDTKSNIFKRIFDRIWKALKSLFKGVLPVNVYSNPGSNGPLSEMFNALYTAKKPSDLSQYTPDIANAEFDTPLNSGAILDETQKVILNPIEAQLITKSLDGLISQFTTKLLDIGKYGAAVQVLRGNERLIQLYDVILKKELNKKLQDLQKNYEEKSSNWDDIEKKYHENNINLLTTALENYGNMKDIIDKKADNKETIISYHLKNSAYAEIIRKETVDTFETDETNKDEITKYLERFGKGGAEVEAYKLATGNTIYLLKTLLKQEIVDGERVDKLNELGFPETIEFKPFFNYLTEKVGGKQNMEDLYTRLLEVENLDIRFQQLLQKLGDPSVVTVQSKEAGDIWLGMVRSFNLNKQDHINNIFKQTITSDGKKTVENKVGKVSADYFPIKNKIWPSLFAVSKSSYVDKNKNNENYLLLDKIVSDFLVKSQKATTGEFIYTVKDRSLYIPFLNAIGLYMSNNYEIIRNIAEDDVEYIANLIGQSALNQVEITNPVAYLSKPHTLNVQKLTREGKIIYQSTKIRTSGGRVDNLAQLQADYSSEYGTQMKVRPDGGKQSVNSLNSSLTRVQYAINSAETNEDFVDPDSQYNYVPHLSKKCNPHVMGSVIMKSIYDVAGQKIIDPKTKEKRSLELFSLVGAQFVDAKDVTKGKSHEDMSFADKYIVDLTNMLKGGYIEGIRHASKSTYTAIKANKVVTYADKKNNFSYIDTAAFIKDSNGDYILGINPFDEMMNIMWPKLEGELRRIKMIKEGIPGNPNFYKDNVKNFDRATQFDYFDDILESKKYSKKIKDKLINEFADQLNDENSLLDLLDEEKNLEFKRVIANQILTYFDNLKKRQEKNVYGKIFGNNVPEFIKELAYVGLEEEEINMIKAQNNAEAIKEAVLFSFAINSSIHSNEVALIELGDTFQFDHGKSEGLKRVPTYNSPGIISPTDPTSIAIINNFYGKPYEEKLIAEGIINKESKPFTRRYNKAIIKESKVKSARYNEYAEMFKNNLIKMGYKGDALTEALYGKDKNKLGSHEKPLGGLMAPYFEIKDGDGQGWVTFDFYRALKVLENNWSAEQEQIYQDVINGKNVAAADIVEIFPVYKLQYAGPLATESGRYPIQSIDKFALLPLIPTLIKDTPLEIIHHQMIKQDIGYALFDSGAKRSYIKADKNSNGDDIYEKNEDGTANTSQLKEDFINGNLLFTPNESYLEYLKNQTEVNNYFKGKGTLSTQVRKLFNVGLYEDGTPITKKAGEKSKAVLSTLKRLTNQMRKELLKELGWTEKNGKLEGNIEDMIGFIQLELEKQGFSQHEIDVIANDTSESVDLSVSPISARLEKLIMAIVNNKLVRLKVNGEPFVQVSSAFTQSVKFKKPTAKQKKLYDDFGTNGLRGYVVDPNGEENTKGVRVKIAFSENYQGLFNTKYFVDGVETNETIAVYKPVLDKDNNPVIDPKTKKPRKKLDFDESFKRLNQMLQTDAWLNSSKNREKIQMTGVRIPVQGPNSTEFAEIWEFLPPSAGPIIIIPAEVVAKSGGDFDVDKLTMYLKNLTRQGTLLEDKYENEEDLEPIINSLQKKIDSLKAGKLLIREYLSDFREAFKLTSKHKKVSKEQYYAFTTYDNKALLETLDKPENQKFLKANFSQAFSIYSKDIKNFKIDEYDSTEETIDALYSSSDELGKTYRELADLKAYKRNFAGAIQNKLVSQMIEVLEMPEMAFALLQPNDTHLVKPLSSDIKKIVKDADQQVDYDTYSDTDESVSYVDSNGKLQTKGNSPTKLTEYDYNLTKQQDFSTGKNILGIIAKENPFNNILNMAGATMEPTVKKTVRYVDPSGVVETEVEKQIDVPLELSLKNNKTVVDGKTVINLSKLSDADKKNRIADVISQLMNGAVDVEKDEWITYIQGNMEAISKITFLLQAGASIEDIAYFMTNPLIREYIKVKNLNDSLFVNLIPGRENASSKTLTKKWLRTTLTGFLSQQASRDKDAEGNISMWALKTSLDEIKKNLKKDIFSKENLKVTAAEKLNARSYEQVAGLMEYLYIDKMLEEYDLLKDTSDVDTTTTGTLFSTQAKIKEIKKARVINTINKKVQKYIENDSVISSFYIQEFSNNLFGRLFKLRNNEKVIDYLLNITDNPMMLYSIKQSTGFDDETFVTQFQNALSLYVLTNKLKQYNKNTKIYKGQPIENLIDLNKVVSEFAQKEYLASSDSSNSYFKQGLYPVSASAFGEDSLDEFIEFNLEREYLRKHAMPFTKALRDSKEFANIVKRFVDSGNEFFQKGETESEIDHETKLNKWAYENMLMNKALKNIYNNYALFRSGDNTVAQELMNIINNYPELKLQFSLLDQFSISTLDNKFKPLENRRNFKINNYAEVDGPLAQEYYNQWKDLTDPNKIQLKDKSENGLEAKKYISNFFSQLPIVSFLQSGMNSGEFSLASIMPVDLYLGVMTDATKDFNKVLKRSDAKVILQGFFNLFLSNNTAENKLHRTRGPNYKRSISELIESGNMGIKTIYNDPFITRLENNVYLLNDSYSEYGNTVKITPSYIEELKENNPNVKFILSNEDLGADFDKLKTSKDLDDAKANIDLVINSLKNGETPVVILASGFGKSTKNNNIKSETTAETARTIYDKLGSKTQSENVILPTDLEENTEYTGKNFWNNIVPEARDLYDDKIDRKSGIAKPMLIAYRGNKNKSFAQNYKEGNTVGNPFDFANETGTREEQGVKSTKRFIHWMITGDNMGVSEATEEYRQAIINDIKSGKITNSPILYYQEKNYATHATALDYLINTYNWSAAAKTPTTTDKFSKKNIFTVTPQKGVSDNKATIKASIATQYIGFGEDIIGKDGKRSTTQIYREQAGKYANTGNYSASDVIFVSIPGLRGDAKIAKREQDKTIKEAIKAVEAGATILTDDKDYTFDPKNAYNTGEKRLYDNMQTKGYTYSQITVDGQAIGTWSKSQAPVTSGKKTIQPGLDLYKNALTKEEQKEFYEFGKSVLEQHGYNPFEQYVMASAGQMEWSPEDVVGKDGKLYKRPNNYNAKIISHKKKIKGTDGNAPRWTYHYYLSNIDGSKITPIPANIINSLEKITGQDMSDYDTVLINLYPKGRTLGWHVDVSEDNRNMDRDIISVSIGADADFYYANTPDDFISGNPEKAGYKVESLNFKSGDVMTFGGPSRLISHTVKNVKGTTDLGPIDLTDSNVNEGFKGGLKLNDDWRMNFTFRVADHNNNKGKRAKTTQPEKTTKTPEEVENTIVVGSKVYSDYGLYNETFDVVKLDTKKLIKRSARMDRIYNRNRIFLKRQNGETLVVHGILKGDLFYGTEDATGKTYSTATSVQFKLVKPVIEESEKTTKTPEVGDVVEYKGSNYILWNINAAGKAQLTKMDGTKFSGTPEMDKLSYIESLPKVEFNNKMFVVNSEDRIFSLSTGNEVYKNATEKPQILAKLKGKPGTEEKDLKEDTSKESKKVGSILQARTNPIEYTSGQIKALTEIGKLIETKKEARYLLAGYAGTGKTTIAENIAKYAQKFDKNAYIVAPTNKAARVLNQKLKEAGVKNTKATTIHKLIYKYDESLGFVKSKPVKNGIIIVDESSMIDKTVMADLLDNTKNNILVFMGDGFQLEQIGQDSGLFGALKNPKIFKDNYGVELDGMTELTEVKRQNLDSNILKVATVTRIDGVPYIPEKSTPDFKVVSNRSVFLDEFSKSIANNEDVMAVVATNAERLFMNSLARKVKYSDQASNILNQNDKLMSVANAASLSNSETFTVENISEDITKINVTFPIGPKGSTYDVYLTEVLTNEGDEVPLMLIPGLDKPSLYHSQVLKAAFENTQLMDYLEGKFLIGELPNGKVTISDKIVIANYGYAMTAHKAQGSQADKVFVNQNYVADNWNPARWYYTAITRAAKDVVILKNNYSTALTEDEMNMIIDEEAQLKELESQKTAENAEDQGSLNGELSVYLSDKLKNNLGYDNPGFSDAPSIDDVISRDTNTSKKDVDDQKLKCNTEE
jgi:alkylated DNA repair dioxygenase AlkB